MRAKRPFKQCFDARSSMASCGHRVLQMLPFFFFFFTTPNFSRVIGLVSDGLSTRIRVGAMSPPPAWMLRETESLITDLHCFASRPE